MNNPIAFAPGRSVSVVIPSKDGGETIHRALGSLVTSARHICEVFIVFSNSPQAYIDSCQSLPQRYAAHFDVKLLDSGQTSSGAIARNCAVPLVRGSYVAFLDDDDEWFDAKLPAYFRHIEQHGIDGDFVLFSTVIGCREDKTQQQLLPSRPYRGEPIADFILSFGGGAQASSIMVPASLARRVHHETAWPRHHDYDFCIRLAEHGARFHHIEAPMAYWYQRGSTAAKGGTFEFCTQWLLAHRHRLSDKAFTGYVGKELFAAARASRDWRALWQFMAEHLSVRQRVRVLSGLFARASKLVLRRGATKLGYVGR